MGRSASTRSKVLTRAQFLLYRHQHTERAVLREKYQMLAAKSDFGPDAFIQHEETSIGDLPKIGLLGGAADHRLNIQVDRRPAVSKLPTSGFWPGITSG